MRCASMKAAVPLLLLTLLAICSGSMSARDLKTNGIIIDGALDNSELDRTLQVAVCHQPALSFFCGLINLAKADPVVATLFSPFTNATLFAPTNRGINNTQKILLAEMGVTLPQLAANAALASKFVRSHLVLGLTPLYTSDWRAGMVLLNALLPQQTLTIIEGSRLFGARRQFYIQSALSNGKVRNDRAGFQSMWNIIGGKGYIQEVENPIIPPAGTS